MPHFVFSTYEDTRVDWLFEAESLDDAKQKITEDTFENLISDEQARPVGSDCVEARDLKTDDGDPGSPPDIEEATPETHPWMFRDLEAEAIQKSRLNSGNWMAEVDLTCFDEFEVHPVRQARDWTGPLEFYCEQCEPDQATFWTVYGHYDHQLERNRARNFVGVDALIDCWSLAEAEKLAIMFAQFRTLQLAAAGQKTKEAAE
jgi:hypothetical protein